MDGLTNKVNECYDLYLNDSFKVFKNPLQNYIKNYCDLIQYQLLITTKNNLYIVWSYNKQTQRIQGTSSRLNRQAQNKIAKKCDKCEDCKNNAPCSDLQGSGKTYRIDSTQQQHTTDRVLSNLFLNVPLILSIDLTHKIDFGTNNKNNIFDGLPVSKIVFSSPYVQTGILAKKQQFLRTTKQPEYLQQFNNPKLNIMYQDIKQK